jgi:hypothetical protein
MQTFLVERRIPPTFHVDDAAQVAMHARWAVDAYRAVGALWIGGVVTEDRMWSLVTAEGADDLARYRQSLGIADADMTVRRIVRPLGPYFAAPQGSVRPPGGLR